MVNMTCALYKKNKDVGLRLKENSKPRTCANKSAKFAPGIQQTVAVYCAGLSACGWEKGGL